MEGWRKRERVWRMATVGLIAVAVLCLLSRIPSEAIEKIERLGRWKPRPTPTSFEIYRELAGVIDAHTGEWGVPVVVSYEVECGGTKINVKFLPLALSQRCRVTGVRQELKLE